MLHHFKHAGWVCAERIRLVSLVSILFGVITTLALIIMSEGALDTFGRPLGTDFSNVYTAGQMVLDAKAPDAYVPSEQVKVQQALFEDPDVPFYAWHYPPFFLILAAGLALLPYTVSWLAWMGLTLPLFIAMVRKLMRERIALWAALGFPAVLVNFLHGQNGFLTAALIGGALLCLRPKPLLAGLLIALLAYKPQFGLLIPIALLAGGHYRTFAAATLALLGMCLGATLIFGAEIWAAFLESRHFSRTVILEAGSTGWYKIQSAFSAVRMWGGSIGFAYAIQALLAASVVAASVWIWRSKADGDLKAASLIAGSLLMTPYMLDYDMVVLAPAMLFLVRYSLKNGFVAYERFGLVLIWLAPILARPAVQHLAIPFGFLAMLALFALVVYKTRLETVTANDPARWGAAPSLS